MPRYLTREWLTAAQEALGTSDAFAATSGDVQLTIQQIVTGGPDGDVAFHVVIDNGTVRLVAGEAADPTVTFTQDWATASAVGRGELSAQGAFTNGRISVRGDVARLVEHAGVFVGVDDALSELRAQTEY